MLSLYTDRLTHVAQLKATNPALYGGTEVTTITTINCFVFTLKNSRNISLAEKTEVINYAALLPLDTLATIGDQLDNIVNSDAVLVLSTSRIVVISEHRHPTDGIRGIEALLKVN